MKRSIKNLYKLLPLLALAGCGLYTPEKSFFLKDKYDEGNIESTVVKNIKCELKKGLQDYLDDPLSESPRGQFIKGWGAQVQVKITVDDMSTVSPGLSLITPLQNGVKTFPINGPVTSPQSFTTGLGASVTEHATRVETISFTHSFADLLAEGRATDCHYENGIQIDSDLRIGQFIFDKMVIATDPGAASAIISKRASPFSVFSDQLTFVATYNGTATPTWKFLRVAADSSGTFFSATRGKTNDVTITLGPATRATASSPAKLSAEATAVHNANITGSATGSAINAQR